MIRPISQQQIQNINNPNAQAFAGLNQTLQHVGQVNRQSRLDKLQETAFNSQQKAASVEALKNNAPVVHAGLTEIGKLATKEERFKAAQSLFKDVPGISDLIDDPDDFTDDSLSRNLNFTGQLIAKQGSGAPSTVQEWQYFNSLSKPDQDRFLNMKRSSVDIKKVGGVETLVNKNTQELTPLNTLESEGSAQAEIAQTKEKAVSRVKSDQQRKDTLRDSAAGRKQSINKAKKFIKLFKNRNMKSGAGRKAASYLPGVYSDQGALDQEFNAFAEVAAREKLKASGELRPTDADVEGMKRAMFGIGADESVNIILLEDFVEQQMENENEFKGLKSPDAPNLPNGVTEEDILETMKSNNMTRKQVMEKLNAR